MRGKHVVVTGAAAGIGAALAERYLREGARVALLDREEIDEPPENAISIRCDVTKEADCRNAFKEVVSAFGGIDVLVNNAGITHLGHFGDTQVDVLRQVMEVNFFGAVNCTKAALPSLLERNGQVIAMSSVAGFAPLVGRTGYSASKHALHGFFDSLRAEYASQGLRVLLVCPSFVDTAIGKHALGGDGGSAPREARTGVRNPTQPSTIADAIVRAAMKNRRLLLFPREATFSWWISRLAPRLFERLMIRRTETPAS
ncbi:MAG: SDR family oxidoreductase [bacterium]|nr:SDR family oxidoreductase [bacterium]